MKILILSCNTGEGHNSSAYSLKAAMKSQGIDCEVQDTIALMSPVASKNVSDAYVYSTKSSLFEHAYKLGEAVSNMDTYFKSPVYAANKIYTKQLYDLIIDGGYDAVVCVHLFPAEALTALKRKAKIAVPTVFVMTDYTCIPFLTETRTRQLSVGTHTPRRQSALYLRTQRKSTGCPCRRIRRLCQSPCHRLHRQSVTHDGRLGCALLQARRNNRHRSRTQADTARSYSPYSGIGRQERQVLPLSQYVLQFVRPGTASRCRIAPLR